MSLQVKTSSPCIKLVSELMQGNYLWGDTFGVHILNRSGDGTWCNGIDCIECQPKESITVARGEGRRKLFGAFDGLILDDKTTQSDRILITHQPREVCYETNLIDIPGSSRAVAVLYIPCGFWHELGSWRFLGVINRMTRTQVRLG